MQSKQINIDVASVIGGTYGVTAEAGQKVYELIKKAFAENRQVAVSFLNIEMLTTAFLNAAIGQLYKDFSEETIKKNLHVENIYGSGQTILQHVTDMANLCYKDPEKFQELQKSIDEIFGH
jgi:hypothetical protein